MRRARRSSAYNAADNRCVLRSFASLRETSRASVSRGEHGVAARTTQERVVAFFAPLRSLREISRASVSCGVHGVAARTTQQITAAFFAPLLLCVKPAAQRAFTGE